MTVNRQVEVGFSIGKYEDFVLCDVVPMEACHFASWEALAVLSYPNFVRGPLLDDMRPFFGPCEVLGIHN